MVEKETKTKKSYIALLLCVLMCIAGIAGYRYYKSRQETKAQQEMSQLDKKRLSDDLTDDNRRNLATSYYNLYKKYPSTTAGRTACYSAAKIYYDLQDYDKVIERLKDCPTFKAQTAAFNAAKYKMMGEAYHHRKDYEKAIACYIKATEEDHGDQVQYLDELADCYKALYDEKKESKDLKEAIKTLKKACDTHPNHEQVGSLLKKKSLLEIEFKSISSN